VVSSPSTASPLSHNPATSDLFDQSALSTLAQRLVEAAKRAGADAADAVAVRGISQGVEVRDGRVEESERSEGDDVGLRVLVGKRQAVVSTNDVSGDGVAKLAERAVAMARVAPDDKERVLAAYPDYPRRGALVVGRPREGARMHVDDFLVLRRGIARDREVHETARHLARNAVAVEQRDAEQRLRLVVALVGRELEPTRRLPGIARPALPFEQHAAEVLVALGELRRARDRAAFPSPRQIPPGRR